MREESEGREEKKGRSERERECVYRAIESSMYRVIYSSIYRSIRPNSTFSLGALLAFPRYVSSIQAQTGLDKLYVLDVGAGPGVYSIYLSKQGHAVHLIDAVPLHVEEVREGGDDRWW